MLATLVEQQPELMALLILVLGSGLALLARRLARWSVARFRRMGAQWAPVAAGGVAAGDLVERVVFWTVLVLSGLLALRVLGLGTLSLWVDRLLASIPNLIFAVIVLVGGYFLSFPLRALVARAFGHDQQRLTPRVAQAALIMVATVTAAEQVGLDVSFAADLLLLVVGLTVAGIALAFAIGSRQLIANLVAAREVCRFQVGDRLRVDEVEGTVVEITSTTVVLGVGDDTVVVPAARFAETVVLHRGRGDAVRERDT